MGTDWRSLSFNSGLPAGYSSAPNWGINHSPPSYSSMTPGIESQDWYDWAQSQPEIAAKIADPNFVPNGATPGLMDQWFGKDGWGKNALGALQGLGSLYMGMKQYGLAKAAFDEQKRQFQMNYDAQRDATNTRMADRQAARYSSDPTFYQSPSVYMDRNRIK